MAHLRVTGKGEKIRYVPLHLAAGERIHEYLEAAGRGEDASGDLFRPVRNNRTGRLDRAVHAPDGGLLASWFASTSTALGFDIGAHALRATAAINALDHAADIAKVQEWLGHANIATARIYDHRKTRPEDSPLLRMEGDQGLERQAALCHRRKDQRHAIVDFGHQFVGIRRDHRECANPLARSRFFPIFPQPAKAKRTAVLHAPRLRSLAKHRSRGSC